jgi:hypothetical protein
MPHVKCASVSRKIKVKFKGHDFFKVKLKMFYRKTVENNFQSRLHVYETQIQFVLSNKFTKKIKKKVTFFSFTHRSGLYGKSIGIDFFFSDKGWIKLFKNAHKSIYELAIENPEIEFVIKTKWEHEWHEQILKDIGDPKNLPNNLIISSDLGV